jgi:hypothetical protein
MQRLADRAAQKLPLPGRLHTYTNEIVGLEVREAEGDRKSGPYEKNRVAGLDFRAIRYYLIGIYPSCLTPVDGIAGDHEDRLCI